MGSIQNSVFRRKTIIIIYYCACLYVDCGKRGTLFKCSGTTFTTPYRNLLNAFWNVQFFQRCASTEYAGSDNFKTLRQVKFSQWWASAEYPAANHFYIFAYFYGREILASHKGIIRNFLYTVVNDCRLYFVADSAPWTGFSPIISKIVPWYCCILLISSSRYCQYAVCKCCHNVAAR